MKLLEELRKDATGLALLDDWLGAGGFPVEQSLAERRAATCISGDDWKPCPFNRGGKWWEKAKDAIAAVIRLQLRFKTELTLHVACEDQLQMCQRCGCCLKLKVHVPIEHIRAHTPPETVEQYPDFCWIRRELSASVKEVAPHVT